MIRRFVLIVMAGLSLASGAALAQAPGQRPIIAAVEENNITNLKLAVMSGGSVNQRTPEGEPALLVAARMNRATLMDYLIEQGASLNITLRSTRETAVMIAATHGSLEALETLIEAGADLDKEDKQGETALMKAVRKGHLSATRLLVEAGADLNRTDYTGRSALTHAREQRETGIFNFLSQKGATE